MDEKTYDYVVQMDQRSKNDPRRFSYIRGKIQETDIIAAIKEIVGINKNNIEISSIYSATVEDLSCKGVVQYFSLEAAKHRRISISPQFINMVGVLTRNNKPLEVLINRAWVPYTEQTKEVRLVA